MVRSSQAQLSRFLGRAQNESATNADDVHQPIYAKSKLSALSDYEAARRAWERTDYEDVVRLLVDRRDSRSKLLLTRTYLRLGKPQLAVDAVQKFRSANAGERLFAELFRVTGEALLRRRGSATFPALPARAARDLRAAHAYYRAVTLWLEGALDEAYVAAESAVASGHGEYHVLGLDLQGRIELSRCRYPAAARRFHEVLATLASSGQPDEYVRAIALHALSSLAVETLRLDLLDQIRAKIVAFVPASGTARPLASALNCLAVADGLLGDEAAAYTTLLNARPLAAPPPFNAAVEIGLADLFVRQGARWLAEHHLTVAERSLNETDWSHADTEARMALLEFACSAAQLRPNSAAGALSKALSLGGKKDPLAAFESAVAQALAFEARGRIALTRKNRDDAEHDLHRAIELWESLGYHYRAARATLVLARAASHVPSALLKALQREIPRSWIAVEAKRLEGKSASPLARVTPAERRVLEKICEGKTSPQIALELGRSPSTIRNQTISLFRTLGVHTRAGLVALVARERSTD